MRITTDNDGVHIDLSIDRAHTLRACLYRDGRCAGNWIARFRSKIFDRQENTMNIRTAILKAADSIEQNPGTYDFRSTHLPDDSCGISGCALGWIAYHANLDIPVLDFGMGPERHMSYNGLIYEYLGIEFDCCFNNLNKANGSEDWKLSAPECAKALRLYADKYHPDAILESVMAIFKTEQITA